MTIIERLQQYKELEPHKIALIVDDIQYTYGELYDAIQIGRASCRERV